MQQPLQLDRSLVVADVGLARRPGRIPRPGIDHRRSQQLDKPTAEAHVSDDEAPIELQRLLHRTIASVRDGFESLRFNTSIAHLTKLNNVITQAYPKGGTPRSVAEPLVLMLAPLAPHIAEELWSKLGHADSLTWTDFPVADPQLLVDETIDVPVQINAKVRAVVTMAAGLDPAGAEAAARADARIAGLLEDKEVRRVIAVPDRSVNFVVA